jgi:hypothetical protein
MVALGCPYSCYEFHLLVSLSTLASTSTLGLLFKLLVQAAFVSSSFSGFAIICPLLTGTRHMLYANAAIAAALTQWQPQSSDAAQLHALAVTSTVSSTPFR